MGDQQFLTKQDLADRYQVSINTVNKWRAMGTGPRVVKVGRHVRYRAEDVLAYEEQHSDPAES
jgi:hypothetical protein